MTNEATFREVVNASFRDIINARVRGMRDIEYVKDSLNYWLDRYEYLREKDPEGELTYKAMYRVFVLTEHYKRLTMKQFKEIEANKNN